MNDFHKNYIDINNRLHGLHDLNVMLNFFLKLVEAYITNLNK